jgi:hypothetical protein
MIKTIYFPLLFVFLVFTGCDKENGFDGTNVYLCNYIEGDTIPIYKKYVHKKFIGLFKTKSINTISIKNPDEIDSLILKQHENYNNCDTFNIASLAGQCKYVIVLKSTTKLKYKSDEPTEEHTIPIIIPIPGLLFIGSATFGGETPPPDYHYYNCITGFVYDLFRKQRVYVFSKVAISQRQEDTCKTCFKTNIDSIFSALSREMNNKRDWRKYQKLNHINLKNNF